CWAGDCKGHRQVLRGPPGYVTDGPGNYSVNGNCEWLIKAPSSNHGIVLNFTFMDTECTYDYLFMLLHLFSDANYNLLGFNATYTFSLCPGDCGGHGRCDLSTSQCQCHLGWGGPDCTTPLAANWVSMTTKGQASGGG
ncbi:hypothetical protein CRUP_004797, partial [Coryphaenoides rupestris]